MKFHFLIFSLFFLTFSPVIESAGIKPLVQKGILDLRGTEKEGKFILQLNGEWEFYWNRMLHPHDFADSVKFNPDCFGKVPSYWTDYAPLAELQSVVELAQRIGYVNRALTWHMVISNLPEVLKPEYAVAVPSYLQEFINS